MDTDGVGERLNVVVGVTLNQTTHSITVSTRELVFQEGRLIEIRPERDHQIGLKNSIKSVVRSMSKSK